MTERDLLAAAIVFIMVLFPVCITAALVFGFWPLIKDHFRQKKAAAARRSRRKSPRRRTALKSARS